MQKFEKMVFKIKNKERAFTFIELLAAIMILGIAILSIIALSAKTYSTISLQKNKLIATNLAKEGIEIVKNIRNENWLYKSNSNCTNDSTLSVCSDGRVAEDEGDCDWRCGSKDIAYSPNGSNGFFRLSQGLKDIDYTGNAVWTNDGGPYLVDRCESDGVPLSRDAQGFYQHSGTLTSFKRLIVLTRTDLNGDGIAANDIRVEVAVCWDDRGRSYAVSVEDHLYNWYKK
jgi:type II secretory pathway pseudopilin PulG